MVIYIQDHCGSEVSCSINEIWNLHIILLRSDFQVAQVATENTLRPAGDVLWISVEPGNVVP